MDQEVPLSPSEAETSWLDYYEIAYRKRTRLFYVRKVGVDCSKPKSKSILHFLKNCASFSHAPTGPCY